MYFVQNGLTAVYHALRLGPAVLNILLNELQCNPKLLPIVSDFVSTDYTYTSLSTFQIL